MRWQDSPDTLRKLAAAYALGTLAGPARRRFEAVMQTHPAAAQAVAAWNRRLAPLAERLPPRPGSAQLWARIERAAFAEPAQAAERRPLAASPPSPGLLANLKRWFAALLAPLPAAALAAGVVFGLALPSLGPLVGDDAADTALPQSYVGVLATAEGRTGMIVSSLRHGRVLDLKRVTALPTPAGQTLYLWVIDASGAASPVGPVPDGDFVRIGLAQPAEAVFAQAVELGLSHEPLGSTPARPSGAYVYRGLCGKLWRVPPASASSTQR